VAKEQAGLGVHGVADGAGQGTLELLFELVTGDGLQPDADAVLQQPMAATLAFDPVTQNCDEVYVRFLLGLAAYQAAKENGSQDMAVLLELVHQHVEGDLVALWRLLCLHVLYPPIFQVA
jgi:hypothetical protein